MKAWAPSQQTRPRAAFSVIELLLVIGIIAMLAAMLMPALVKTQARAKRIECVGNLREIGMAFHLFANDHNHKYPMQTSAADGGTQDATTSFTQFGVNTYRHFQVLSRELGSTKIVTCPMDSRAKAANWASLNNTNVSYFVWLSASPTVSSDLLSGDRNVSWTGVVPADLKKLGDSCYWDTNIHRACGNVVFADGHVELLDTPKLSRAINLALQK